jgi:hypothetical protein
MLHIWWGGGPDTRIHCRAIPIEPSVPLIYSRNPLPQGLGTLAAAAPDLEGDDLPGRGIHRKPDPVPVRFLPPEAPQLVQLGLQLLQDHRRGAAW